MSEINPSTIKQMANPKEFIADYWQERAAEFSKMRRQELLSPKNILWQQEITSRLPSGKPLRILDVGCGAGFFTVLLTQNGHRVTGIDLTSAMIEEAQSLARAENCAADFAVMDAEKLTFADCAFDAVIARNVTWNLPHPQQAYAEWLRVLKPGGLLLNFDAEHARSHHAQLPAHNAHAEVAPELLERCHRIYHMLDISLYERPTWDVQILQSLGASKVDVDTAVGRRIYAQEDDFYIPAPMFGIFAVK